MLEYYQRLEKCPVHPDEYLQFINLGIKTPDDSHGMAYPSLSYCPTENKFFDGKKMITPEEYALKMVNAQRNKNYKLEDITITFDIKKLIGQTKN